VENVKIDKKMHLRGLVITATINRLIWCRTPQSVYVW